MSLNKLIVDTLKPVGVPVMFQTYTGKESTYITFFEYNRQGALHADDDETQTQHSIQVDIWSKGDYASIANQVRALMKGAGFRRNSESESYEKETQLYHKTLRYYYTI